MATDKQPLLKERTPTLNYTKRYDQVSWRSADTDFEVDPSASSADESSRPNVKTSIFHFCTKRQRKLIALVVVIVTFLAIMSGLIYLYYSKSSDTEIEETSAVSTDAGPVSGVIETIEVDGVSKRTFLFKGIPYAIPPIGKLRFSPPVAINQSNGWKNRYRAIKFSSPCVQVSNNGDIEGTEDCLYLNVFTPSLSQSNLPVILWIHGGSLMVGNGNSPGYSPNSEFVTSMNVVGVSMNYRLNAFGFLTLKELWEEGKSYGNYGIMDQILVLKWIQNNIKNFGGDPDSVTIIGEESGGTCALGLLASPLTDGLFHKVISMSGSPKIERTYEDASRDNIEFLNQTKCMTSLKIKDCLLNMSISEITKAIPNNIYPYWSKTVQSSFPIKGVISGALVTIDPIVITQKIGGEFDFKRAGKEISVLLGTTAQDIGLDRNENLNVTDIESLKSLLKERLNAFADKMYHSVVEETYADLFTRNMSCEYIYETLISDVRINCPTNTLLSSWIKKTSNLNVFRYVVSNKPEYAVQDFGAYSFTSWDTLALFGFVTNNYKASKKDLMFQKVLRESFGHFIRYGHTIVTDWQIGKTGEFTDSGTVAILSGSYHKQYCPVWNNLLDYTRIN